MSQNNPSTLLPHSFSQTASSRFQLSDKLAAMGVVAAGVAHEINNPLTYVSANQSLIAEELHTINQDNLAEKVIQIKAMLEKAEEGLARVKHVVQSLKNFSHAPNESPTAVDVHKVLDCVLRLTNNEIKHRARLDLHYQAVPQVLATENHLGQVFLNLIINATHAIPQGEAHNHTISIRTYFDTCGFVNIEIEDTGEGIPDHILKRLFEPFQTSKPKGQGTGLGLSICKEIIDAFHGAIEVNTTRHVGTLFRIKLPSTTHNQPQNVTIIPESPFSSSYQAKILVIDDEILLTDSLQTALGKEHKVMVTHHAKDALLLLSRDDSFDVILCDVMMPGMTGMQLYTQVKNMSPHIARRFVFMTGGTFTNDAKQFLQQVTNVRIEKPFSLTQIRELLQRILHKKHLTSEIK